MLRRPRPLPRRFNRPVTPLTRSVVQRRHPRTKQRTGFKVQRAVQRFQRRSAALRKMAVRFLSLVVGGGVLLIIGLALFSSILEIQQITVVRTDPRIDVEQIQQSLAPLFGEHLFFLNNQQVRDLLTASIPDLESAVITKEYPATINIRPQLHPIIARLTIEDPNEGTAQTGSGVVAATGAVVKMSHFLTEEGVYVAYPALQVQAGTGILALHIVDWGVRPEPGMQLVVPELLTVMQAAEKQLTEEFNHIVSERRVYIRAREFHLRTEKYSLWFDMRSPLEEALQRYRLFLESAGQEAATEYIDLRLKDKIVYK